MMFKVIVRNFFVCTQILLAKFYIVSLFYAIELLTLSNCRKNLLL